MKANAFSMLRRCITRCTWWNTNITHWRVVQLMEGQCKSSKKYGSWYMLYPKIVHGASFSQITLAGTLSNARGKLLEPSIFSLLLHIPMLQKVFTCFICRPANSSCRCMKEGTRKSDLWERYANIPPWLIFHTLTSEFLQWVSFDLMHYLVLPYLYNWTKKASIELVIR